MSSVVLAGVTPEVRELIVDALAGHEATLVDKHPDEELLLPEGEEVDLVVLGELVSAPLSAVHQLAARNEKTAVLIVVAPERAADVERSIRYSPVLPGDVRSVRSDRPDDVGETARSMAVKSRRSRRFSSILPRLREKMPPRSPADQTTLYLDTLLDYAPIGVLVIDPVGTVVDLNPETRRFLSSLEGPARGRPLSEMLPASRREDVAALLSDVKTAGEGSVSRRLRWPPDERTFVEVTAARLARGGETEGTMIILRDVTADVSVERAESELRQQRAVAQALEGQADELRRLNRELEARNEELQQFAYMASHDLQEPLRKIASFVDLLIEDSAERLGEDGRFYLDRMQSAALRMSELIRGLLRFSRVRTESSDVGPVDLNEILENVLSDLSMYIEEMGAEIDVDELPVVWGDAGQLSQLFQNLISNGIKFSKEEEFPRVRVYADEHAAEVRDRTAHRITVSDNGIGFDDKYADRIFAPFQRLHSGARYPGTGMGLAICARIVERHEGRIEVESQPGEGSAFTVYLPTTTARTPRPT